MTFILLGRKCSFLYYFCVLEISTISTMPRGGNYRRVADPLDMAIFESDDYALFGCNNLRPSADRPRILK
jgi:hypothetical protein